MRLDDFCRLDFDEFGAVVEAWNAGRDAEQRAEWERARWQACLGLQPHTRKGQRLRPEDLVIFPWEDGKAEHPGDGAAGHGYRLTAAEQRRRMEEVAEQFGVELI